MLKLKVKFKWKKVGYKKTNHAVSTLYIQKKFHIRFIVPQITQLLREK